MQNRTYWQRKIGGNIERDLRVRRELARRGWRVLRLWEHSLDAPARVSGRIFRALAVSKRGLQNTDSLGKKRYAK